MSNLTPEQKYLIVSAELKARGLKPAVRKKEKQKENWRLGENGFFTRSDGNLYIPTKTQGEFINSDAQFSAFIGARGSGKSLSITTEIPTIDGWKLMGDIEVGDILFDEKGQKTTVIGISPIMKDHLCYRITFSDNSTVIADAEHLWTVRTLHSLKKDRSLNKNLDSCITLTTEEIIERKLKVGNNYGYCVDICDAVEYDTKELLIHPYLLGVWLGDGNSREAKLTIHTGDEETINKIMGLGYPIHKVSGKYSWSLGNLENNKSNVQIKLKSLGVLNNKHIPDDYLHGNKAQRMELLMGLMDTDGTVSKRGHCSFDSKNLELAQQVHQLVSSLGIKATINEFYSRYNGEKYKYFKVAFTPQYVVFSLQRKIIRQHLEKVRSDVLRRSIINIEEVESVLVKCIRVDSPNNLFLVTRSFIPTHNTAAGAQKALKKVKEGLSGSVLNPDF